MRTPYRVNEGIAGWWVSRGPGFEINAVNNTMFATRDEAQAEADRLWDQEVGDCFDYLIRLHRREQGRP
jgi:hypothetical protein